MAAAYGTFYDLHQVTVSPIAAEALPNRQALYDRVSICGRTAEVLAREGAWPHPPAAMASPRRSAMPCQCRFKFPQMSEHSMPTAAQPLDIEIAQLRNLDI
jgi:hypothetical protein